MRSQPEADHGVCQRPRSLSPGGVGAPPLRIASTAGSYPAGGIHPIMNFIVSSCSLVDARQVERICDRAAGRLEA